MPLFGRLGHIAPGTENSPTSSENVIENRGYQGSIVWDFEQQIRRPPNSLGSHQLRSPLKSCVRQCARPPPYCFLFCLSFFFARNCFRNSFESQRNGQKANHTRPAGAAATSSAAPSRRHSAAPRQSPSRSRRPPPRTPTRPAPSLRRRMNIELNFPPNFERLVLGCIDADFCK